MVIYIWGWYEGVWVLRFWGVGVLLKKKVHTGQVINTCSSVPNIVCGLANSGRCICKI